MFCIPATSQCPITHIEIAAGGAITTSTDPKHGLPIIDVVLSQGGEPCFREENFNNDLEKQKSLLMNEVYNMQCPAISVNGKDYIEAKMFYKEVNGFRENFKISEYDILKSNSGISLGS